MLARAAAWVRCPSLEHLTAESVREITRTKGVEFATALLFDRVQRSNRHARFIEEVADLRQQTPVRDLGVFRPRIVIVPGALYVERPDLGGDGQLVREVADDFGLPCERVPLASTGTLRQNARRLLDWLEDHGDSDLVLVTLSKAGAETKLALSSSAASREFRNVRAWINVCGPLDGAPLVNWLLAGRLRSWTLRMIYRVRRRDFGFVTELGRGPGSVLDFPFQPPPAMQIVNIVGFPLRHHFTSWFAQFCHGRLARLGPNDGTILLSDVLGWPGQLLPVWGADHYFRPADRAKDIVAAVLTWLSRSNQPGHLDSPTKAVTSRTTSSLTKPGV